MGNLNEQSWDELWNSEQAEHVRAKVRNCDRQCWMIGSVSPAMHKYIWKPALWVIHHKFLRAYRGLIHKKKYSMYEIPAVRDYRDGKVTREELDACSTCDLSAQCLSNGLSSASQELLRTKSGEDFVAEDMQRQKI